MPPIVSNQQYKAQKSRSVNTFPYCPVNVLARIYRASQWPWWANKENCQDIRIICVYVSTRALGTGPRFRCATPIWWRFAVLKRLIARSSVGRRVAEPRHSALDPFHLRIVERGQMKPRRHRLVRDHQFIGAGAQIVVADTVRIADIAIADRLAKRVAEAGAGQVADGAAVAQDGLAADQDDLGVIQGEARDLLLERYASSRDANNDLSAMFLK